MSVKAHHRLADLLKISLSLAVLFLLLYSAVWFVQESQIERYYNEDATNFVDSIHKKCGTDEVLPIEFDVSIGLEYNARYGQFSAVGHADNEAVKEWVDQYVWAQEYESIVYDQDEARRLPGSFGNYDGEVYQPGIVYHKWILGGMCEAQSIVLVIRSTDNFALIYFHGIDVEI